MKRFGGLICEQVWISAALTPWRQQLDIRLGMLMSGKKIAVAQPITFQEDQDEGQEIPPFMSLGPDEWQRLMDEMWRAGIRPTSGAGTATEAGALERHLADMRKLAFHALKVPANENSK